ncbi:MAG: hypothetical protein JKX98_07280 [Alcanivoracaceae bacterium]|nr:hypothetical protein [Alcanivoracaceae bacterium]
MRISVILFLIMSISIVDATTATNNGANDNGNIIIHKVCLFHDHVYEIIPGGLGECSFVVPGNIISEITDLNSPHDPDCFSEFLRFRHNGH